MAFQGEQPTAPLVVGTIVTSPIWIPCLAIYGAYHGIKAGIVHGVIPAVQKLAAVSKKPQPRCTEGCKAPCDHPKFNLPG